MKRLTALWFLVLVASARVAMADFELYVVDVGPNRGPPWQVLKYDAEGRNPQVFIDAPLNRPQDIVFLEDRGVALVSSLGSNRIHRHDATNGELIDVFAANAIQPTRIKIGPDGLLYVLQWAGTGRVLRYDMDGVFIDAFTSVGVSNSIGLDWDEAGDLYVASFNQARVRRFDSDGNDLGPFVSNNLLGPTNIWFDGDGDLLVMDWTGGSIKRFDANGSFQGVVVGGLSEPEGIEFLDGGHFLVGNGGTSAVREYDANGNFVGDFVASGSGGLAKPNAVRIRPLADPFALNAGLNGAWFNAATPGQGLMVEIIPSRSEVFVAWFTFEQGGGKVGDSGHRWLTAQGNHDGNTANLTLLSTSGGEFDQSLEVTTILVGTATLSFGDCESARFDYEFDDGPDGGFDLGRVAPDVLCGSLEEASP